MPDNDEEMENEVVDREKFAVALELGRLVAEETGLCCGDLARFVWECYQGLTGEIEDAE